MKKQNPAGKPELLAWAMFDFANSGYTTVILTAVFNAYFVAVIAGDLAQGTATLLWTITIAIANGLVLLTAPVLGAIADYRANKKQFLAFTTAGCVIFTALLALCGPGDITLTMIFLIVSAFMFYSGENFIASFLPELASRENMGKVSALGWSIGYFGGLLILGLCLLYVQFAQERGDGAEQFVPVTTLIVAISFLLASLPTFLWMKERAVASPHPHNFIRMGFTRLRTTLSEAHRFRDLFRFLIALTVFYCGINTVILLAAVYAQQAMGFDTQDTLTLVLVVNVTAAVGAFLFGHVQDRIGSLRTLNLTLALWISAMVLAFFSDDRASFWLVANLVGLALGSSQSAGRAMVALFTPTAKNGEFFGLWGLATKLAAIIGPLVYGLITHLSGNDHRLALLSTTAFFIAGMWLLRGVDEERGHAAAHEHS